MGSYIEWQKDILMPKDIYFPFSAICKHRIDCLIIIDYFVVERPHPAGDNRGSDKTANFVQYCDRFELQGFVFPTVLLDILLPLARKDFHRWSGHIDVVVFGPF